MKGPWHLEALVARGARAFGRRARWIRPLVRRLLAAFDPGRRPTQESVASFVLEDVGFRRVSRRKGLALVWTKPEPAVMFPAPGAPSSWPVPAIVTPRALAERLALLPSELDWFADCQARGRRAAAGALRHYRYRWQAKRSGSSRLIEAPKPRLKLIQRQLLDEILEPIPPHDAAHGFRAGRSVRSYIDGHVGQSIVLKMDLRDFFPTISAARITALFLTAGYPEPVARLLSGLCTNSVPSDVWADPSCPIHGPEHWRLRRLYRAPHLPQGAPTSPALANLCAHRLDCRLSALANQAEGRYTRYADDLVFSGGLAFAKSIERFPIHVGAVALEEGFVIQPRKTRVMRQGVRQRVAGVVLNERPNVPRADYDTLKAILHNCVRHGPQSQNREARNDFRAHLAGRIAYVASLNPERGKRLRAVFQRIPW